MFTYSFLLSTKLKPSTRHCTQIEKDVWYSTQNRNDFCVPLLAGFMVEDICMATLSFIIHR